MDTDCIFYIYVPSRENLSSLCSHLKTKTKKKQTKQNQKPKKKKNKTKLQT